VSAVSFRLVPTDVEATDTGASDAGATDTGASDAEDGTDDRDVTQGELWMSGPQLMLGYWNNPEGTKEAIVDGWYRTGDVAMMDSSGFLTIVDRVKDMIISGGLNVYPAEVERVLDEHPAVQDACVVGLADDRWGEVVAAAVVCRSDAVADEEELAQWCADRLAGYKKPRVVRVLDELPKGSTGKVSKRDVRALLSAAP